MRGSYLGNNITEYILPTRDVATTVIIYYIIVYLTNSWHYLLLLLILSLILPLQ
nr:MAG TPA: hypothetical protein [Caudoviricetes sp.]